MEPNQENTQTPALSESVILAEATNDPKKAVEQFELGGRTFPVVSLGYKQYLQFVGRLKPILELLVNKVRQSATEAADTGEKLNVQGIALNALRSIDPHYLMTFCAEDLPAMVEIICNMSAIREDKVEDMVTTKWVEDNTSSPFKLIEIVLMQVNKNSMIQEFADFFVKALPLFLSRKTVQSLAR